MSRIIVKNIPNKFTKEKVRQLFEKEGSVTDVNVKCNQKNNRALYAFVGFKTKEEAEKAVVARNKTFVNANKITVELCTEDNFNKTGKHRIEANTHDRNENKEAELLLEHKDAEHIEEFISIHQSSLPNRGNKVQSKKQCPSNKTEENSDFTEEIVPTGKESKKFDLHVVKLLNLPYNCKKREIKQFLKPTTPFTIRIPRNIHGIAYVGYKAEKGQKMALLKDKNFIGSKQICVKPYISKTEETSTTSGSYVKRDITAAVKEVEISGKIFMRNLTYTTSKEDIEGVFSKFGPIAEVSLPVDRETQQIKGFGTVTFMIPEHAAEAFKKLDGTTLAGRILHLLPAKENSTNGDDLDNKSTTFKQQRGMKRKNEKSTRSWNTLFLGESAIAETMADAYNVSKEDLLDPHNKSKNAAVRLALGETQIVAETRKFLEAEGIVLDAFDDEKVKRSRNIIIVKNLPFKTDQNEIRQLFQKFGSLSKVVVPSHATTALVAFLEASEARKCFLSLAYSKFKNVPLYLEWAPENSISQKATQAKSTEDTISEETSAEQTEVPSETTEKVNEFSVLVRNLHWETTVEKLNKHFSACGLVSDAVLNKESDPRSNERCGLVKFTHKHSLDKALKSMQNSMLDGSCIKVEKAEQDLSQKNTIDHPLGKSKTKMLVRNVPFQANIDEIRSIFSTFGELKATRLPKKMGEVANAHRGFAFVEYALETDAQKAFEALCRSTHLLGRRLVLEWASAVEEVNQIRKRNADHFGPLKSTRKSMKSVFSLDV